MTKKEVKSECTMTKKEVKKKKNETVSAHYLRSMRFDATFWMTVIYDFSYCITAFVFFIIILWIFSILMAPFTLALLNIGGIFSVLETPSEVSHGIETSLTAHFAAIKLFYIKAALWFFGSILILFAVTSIYKSLIWSNLTQQRFTQKYFVKFFVVNILWQIMWLLVASATFFLFDVTFATYFLLIILFLYMYFTPFLRSQFTTRHTLKSMYTEAFIRGVKNIPHFVVPIFFIFITVTVALWIAAALLQFIASLSLILFTAAGIFVAISWVRFYFSIVANNLK